jgi:hypothetical protein
MRGERNRWEERGENRRKDDERREKERKKERLNCIIGKGKEETPQGCSEETFEKCQGQCFKGWLLIL